MHHWKTGIAGPNGLAPILSSGGASPGLAPVLGGAKIDNQCQSVEDVDHWVDQIRGARLARVIYSNPFVGYPHGFLPWDRFGVDFDAAGEIEFRLENGVRLALGGWSTQLLEPGPEGLQGVGYSDVYIDFITVFDGFREGDADVTSHSRWANLMGVPVVNVDVYWGETPHGSTGTRYWAPQDVVLTFEGGYSLLLATTFGPSSEATDQRYEADILIVFDEDVAIREGLGPYV